MELAGAAWPEVDGFERATLVIAVGSTEQHGPHLPLSTDTLIAQAVAVALASSRSDAALAPTVPIGASGEHAAYAGTLSVGTDALYTYLLELVRHAVPTWGRVLIVNGHGGNAPALTRLKQTCDFERRPLVIHHCHVPGGDAHAGRTETSLMLHLAPELVRGELSAPGNAAPIADLLPAMREGGVHAVSPNGILGDPTGASAAEGAELMSALVAAAESAYDAGAGKSGQNRDR